MSNATALALLGGFGVWEIMLVMGIILLLFGATKIPELARSMGKGVDEFKKGLRGEPERKGITAEEPNRIEEKTAMDS
ncbi:MAG: twin-arginine translocase TatA/TatE family subunit [Planctomycetota bacterium]|jgi:sec-independent protein translocase protein TatA